jgi:threonine dehydrogenase-like Zn-dependent dehydrogenase
VAHPGGFTEYLLYCAHAVHHLPEGASLEEEALTDTPAVGVTALDRIRMHLSGSVLIIGPGRSGGRP